MAFCIPRCPRLPHRNPEKETLEKLEKELEKEKGYRKIEQLLGDVLWFFSCLVFARVCFFAFHVLCIFEQRIILGVHPGVTSTSICLDITNDHCETIVISWGFRFVILWKHECWRVWPGAVDRQIGLSTLQSVFGGGLLAQSPMIEPTTQVGLAQTAEDLARHLKAWEFFGVLQNLVS